MSTDSIVLHQVADTRGAPKPGTTSAALLPTPIVLALSMRETPLLPPALSGGPDPNCVNVRTLQIS